ncbi:tyrosine-type recombinase/integrase [Virgibacillus sp. L01]|uniref:tyrosine-type recombinase/integrase n=1 Tax=Virgibacillus sp. L01 TaxID=3457429 RepID=UPI003FCFDD14
MMLPINKKIQPLIRKRMNQEKKYLFLNSKGNKLAYNVFRPDFISLMEKLSLNHKPHDSRHTFATLMDNAGANKISIQKIMGHASQGITDKVYTHKNIEELKKAIDLI